MTQAFPGAYLSATVDAPHEGPGLVHTERAGELILTHDAHEVARVREHAGDLHLLPFRSAPRRLLGPRVTLRELLDAAARLPKGRRLAPSIRPWVQDLLDTITPCEPSERPGVRKHDDT